ncbi:unnamed protein product [Effrenium voratum]|nr:unnamed protein product [Effrenium voratum]
MGAEKLGTQRISAKARGPVRGGKPSHPVPAGVLIHKSLSAGRSDAKTFEFAAASERGFDRVFQPSTSQPEVFQGAGLENFLDAVMEGYHATVFAYGQTGSGKTHTMEGFVYQAVPGKAPQVKPGSTPSESLGLVPRSIEGLFRRMESKAETDSEQLFTLRLSFLQIYNERIFDLLNPVHLSGATTAAAGLRLRWNSREAAVSVENLFVFECRTPEEALGYYKAGVRNRTVASHQMNQASSRSHSVLMLTVERRSGGERLEHSAKLTLVDLAGSERQAATGASGRTLQESVGINQSLFVLRKVITSLAKKSASKSGSFAFVPYRESKLTVLLRDAIGGSGYTLMLACLSTLEASFEESLSTLHYACTAGSIRNRPAVNLDPMSQLVRRLRQEVQSLKGQLEAAQRYVIHLTGQPIPLEVLQGNAAPPEPPMLPPYACSAPSPAASATAQAPQAAPAPAPPPQAAQAPQPSPRVFRQPSDASEEATPRAATPRAPAAPAPPTPASSKYEEGGVSRELLEERLLDAVASLRQCSSENFALRRSLEQAVEAREAAQQQLRAERRAALAAAADAAGGGGSGGEPAGAGPELAALGTMRASMFYDVLVLREELAALKAAGGKRS